VPPPKAIKVASVERSRRMVIVRTSAYYDRF